MTQHDLFASAFARILIRYAVGPFLVAVFSGAPVVAEMLADPDFQVVVEIIVMAIGTTISVWLAWATEIARVRAKTEGGDL